MLTDKVSGKRPVGSSRRRWEKSIRMDFKEIGASTRNWTDSAQDRDYWRTLVNVASNLQVPYGVAKLSLDHHCFITFYDRHFQLGI